MPVIASLVLALTAPGHAQSKKPRVPVGIDPGGVMVAIAADSGIDYTRPEIASRLARDGEGELIGWNFADDDRLPYAPSGSAQPTTDLAHIILADAPAARLAVFRARPGDTIALGRLAVYAARSRARVVLVTSASAARSDWEAFAQAIAHFKSPLVIVPAAPGLPPFPAALGLDNMLTVTALEDLNAPARDDHPPPDLAMPASGKGASAAAARATAVAARLLATEPTLEGAALKSRIVGLAAPLPPPLAGRTRHGRLAEP